MDTASSSHQPTIAESPPKLDTSTGTLLDEFLNQKKREKALFESLKSRSSSRSRSTNTDTPHGSSISSSSASSISSKQKSQNKRSSGLDSRNVLDLLPRGRRCGKRRNGTKREQEEEEEEEEEEDEASLLAQAEALADLERLNGVEPSIPISAVQEERRNQDSDASGDEDDENKDEDEIHESDRNKPWQMDVDEFRRYFGESWQLSQFWYSSEFSYHLARSIHALLKNEHNDRARTSVIAQSTLEDKTSKMTLEETDAKSTTKTETSNSTSNSANKQEAVRIGFISCPTGYVGFRYLYPEFQCSDRHRHQRDEPATNPHDLDHSENGNRDDDNEMQIESYLFEYDDRFSLLTPPASQLPSSATIHNPQPAYARFIHYDLHNPLALPEYLAGKFDMLVLDPPYLNRDTNLKIARTVEMLLRRGEAESSAPPKAYSLAACSITPSSSLSSTASPPAPAVPKRTGKVLLITGRSVADEACQIYGDAIGTGTPLRKSEKLEVEHRGLANDFGAWGNWDGIEDFGG